MGRSCPWNAWATWKRGRIGPIKDVDRRYADVVPLNEVLDYLATLPRDAGR